MFQGSAIDDVDVGIGESVETVVDRRRRYAQLKVRVRPISKALAKTCALLALLFLEVYDIVYTSPRFANGKVPTPGYVIIFRNGIITQNHTQLLGASAHHALPHWVAHDVAMPIKLQYHRMPVRFRNVWVRPLSEQADP